MGIPGYEEHNILNIHQLTQEQYENFKNSEDYDENAFYLVPDFEPVLNLENGTGEGSLQQKGCTARGENSFASGKGTIASQTGQQVFGQYNVENSDNDDDKYLFIIGNGESNDERQNCFTVDENGNVWVRGNVYVSDYEDEDYGAQLATQGYVRNLDSWFQNGDGWYSVELPGCTTTGDYCLAGGNNSTAGGGSSFAWGTSAKATGYFSFASGSGDAIGQCSHAEGDATLASGQASHAEGSGRMDFRNFTGEAGATTYSSPSFCTSADIGKFVVYNKVLTVVLDVDTNAKTYTLKDTLSSSTALDSALVYFYNSAAIGMGSHVEGSNTTASGNYSHAEGFYTIASGDYSHVQGNHNIEDINNEYAHIVGNGNFDTRSNAHTLDWSGNAWFAGDVYVGSASGTNRDEGSFKLPKFIFWDGTGDMPAVIEGAILIQYGE